MWLGLYQSLSIWLVRGPAAFGSHRAMVPQVQIGGRPIASSTAAAIAAISKATQAGAGGSGHRPRHSMASRLQSGARLTDHPRPCCVRTDPDAMEAASTRRIRKSPRRATWIDLEEPTRPRKSSWSNAASASRSRPVEEMAEIEPSSRLYEHRRRALHDRERALRDRGRRNPIRRPIGFVLAPKRLVTVRYVSPKPVRAFIEHAGREPELVADALITLCGLLDAIVDRLADELEDLGAEIEKIACAHLFADQAPRSAFPPTRLTMLLNRIGRTQLLLAKIRETETSISRLLNFLGIDAAPARLENAADRARAA